MMYISKGMKYENNSKLVVLFDGMVNVIPCTTVGLAGMESLRNSSHHESYTVKQGQCGF